LQKQVRASPCALPGFSDGLACGCPATELHRDAYLANANVAVALQVLSSDRQQRHTSNPE
jgi:hypothetical protein